MTIFKRFSIFCAKILAKESQHIADEHKYETINGINNSANSICPCLAWEITHFYVYAGKTTITDVICIKCNHKTTIRKILASKERKSSRMTFLEDTST